ncbi:MAG: hypothetical protein RSD82_13340 [Comamonas sp.]
MTKSPQSANPTESPKPSKLAKTPQSKHPLFSPGRIVATPGALDLLSRAEASPHELLHRHVCGDWAEMDREDQAANHDAVRSGARILSSFNVQGAKLWIITEAISDVTEDGRRKAQASRSSTCFLLPEEY